MKDTHILGDNAPRKSNFDPDLARKLTQYYEEHPEELNDKLQVPIKPTDINEQQEKYVLMPQTNTYALGVHALQEACIKENSQNHPQFTLPDGKVVYRPNTFLENISARIKDYYIVNNPDGTPRSMEERLSFWDACLDSCCGIAYKKGSPKLKLNLQCPELIGIAKDFNGLHLPVNYDDFPCQIELDSSSSTFVSDGWIALLERKMDIHDEYLALLKTIEGPETIPHFWVRHNPSIDELRTAYISNIDGHSHANGDNYLTSNGCFLHRSS